MNLSLTAISFLAQAQVPASQSVPIPKIKDIVPPVWVFPYPLWMVVCAAIIALIILGLIVWLIVYLIRSRPSAPPPSPQSIALKQLREAREKIGETNPHEFSISVSEILRHYISAQYHLRVTRQTTQEFLESLTDSSRFGDEEKTLLANFLEKCDLIKFANVHATQADSEALLDEAFRFVERSAQ